MKPSITVIIPVFNAFSTARDCLESVRQYSSAAARILVLDDASSEGIFAEYVKDFSADSRFEFIRNQNNLGFVKTCNTGMRLAKADDVILLNSDTLVTANWINKLTEAAYSSDRIATVTPLTNNGVICSVPQFCHENTIPAALSLESWSQLIETANSDMPYQELPSCVGFCVYLKRAVLDEIGLFDEVSFGLGYGEENDLSLRAQSAGYVDILDHKTFIYHKGNCSFLGLRETLSVKNLETLRKRYPHYLDRVSKFCSRNPLLPIQKTISDLLVDTWNADKPRLLHILHNGPEVSRGDPLGGTELHVQDLISHIETIAHWSLVSAKGYYYLSAHMPGHTAEYILPIDSVQLSDLISTAHFDLVHLHHSRWFDHTNLVSALLEHGRFMLSFHDYSLVCPRFHLLTPADNVCTGIECVSACGYRKSDIAKLRESSLMLLQNAQKRFCFSHSTKSYIENILQESFSWEHVQHGTLSSNSMPHTLDESESSRFNIAVIGTITRHKGAALFEELFTVDSMSDAHITWNLFGDSSINVPPAVNCHGPYRRSELPELLSRQPLHLAVFLSICPETYGLTVDEALLAGIPVLVGPYGAPKERVERLGVGWVADSLQVDSILEKIRGIIQEPDEYLAVRRRVAKVLLPTVITEAEQHREHYTNLLPDDLSTSNTLRVFIKRLALHTKPQEPLHWRILGFLANSGIHLLDTLGIRGSMQRIATSWLPVSVLNKIKRAR